MTERRASPFPSVDRLVRTAGVENAGHVAVADAARTVIERHRAASLEFFDRGGITQRDGDFRRMRPGFAEVAAGPGPEHAVA